MLQIVFPLLILINIDQIFQKKIIFELADQGASKLEALKVCSDRDSNPGRPKTKFTKGFREKRSLEPKMSQLFFDRQLCTLVTLIHLDQN